MKEVDLLNSFITNNKELELLEAKLNKFNPFKILQIEGYELKHSNILFWLLDPKENHGLRDEFLKRMVCDVLHSNEEIKTDVKLQDIYLEDLNDSCYVNREYSVNLTSSIGYIDILIRLEKLKVIILIENKIYAKEKKGKLEGYLNAVQKEYSDYEILPIFLSLTEEEPSISNKYFSYSYKNIIDLLKLLIDLYKDGLSDRIVNFIKYYINTLEGLTMSNEEVINLCKRIYQKHKKAIDLIIEYGPALEFDCVFEEFESNTEDKIKLHSKRPFKDEIYYWFTNSMIRDEVPEIADDWETPYPIAYGFKFDLNNNRLKLILEVGTFLEQEKRLEFIKHIDKHGEKVKLRADAFKIKSKHSKIFTEYQNFNDWDDQELLLKRMKKLYEDIFEEIHKDLNQIITSFNF
ncbi:PD-(D/E)XK nuclease family protein [Fuchsiella alkaliacetigena]|nr:PD-(D/E)XK nuclease family protein [Fuchsiella alkaliacetigena]